MKWTDSDQSSNTDWPCWVQVAMVVPIRRPPVSFSFMVGDDVKIPGIRQGPLPVARLSTFSNGPSVPDPADRRAANRK